jgi:hypothetical protein
VVHGIGIVQKDMSTRESACRWRNAVEEEDHDRSQRSAGDDTNPPALAFLSFPGAPVTESRLRNETHFRCQGVSTGFSWIPGLSVLAPKAIATFLVRSRQDFGMSLLTIIEIQRQDRKPCMDPAKFVTECRGIGQLETPRRDKVFARLLGWTGCIFVVRDAELFPTFFLIRSYQKKCTSCLIAFEIHHQKTCRGQARERVLFKTPWMCFGLPSPD